MLDETGCEFGVGVEANTRSEALEILREDYVESRCVQLESPEDTAERERRMYAEIEREQGYYVEEDDDFENDHENDEGFYE
jgi:hypothetical protein